MTLITPLRLLIIEDNEHDAELVLRELRRARFDPVGPRVETEAEFLAQLNNNWDLIISDYSLPQFDALQALEHVNKHKLDIPFIMVSGTVGEDVAVLALQQGAADYLLKDRLGRLGDAIRNALERHQLRQERKASVEAIRFSEARLRMAAAAAQVGTWDHDLLTGDVTLSETLAELKGFPSNTTRIPYQVSYSRVHADDLEDYLKSNQLVIAGGQAYEIEFRYLLPDGRTRWVAERGQVVERDGEGRAVRMLGVTVDITTRKEAEEALQLSEGRFRALVQHAADIVVVFEIDGSVRYVSPSIERVLGFPPETFVGTSRFAPYHPDDLPGVHSLFVSAMEKPGITATSELRVQHSDGSWRRLEVAITNFATDPFIKGVVVNARDITERVVLEEQLRHQAFHDALTGLPNRALALDRLSHALARAGRSQSRIGLLFLDLDNFKDINDRLGHSAGDELLVAIGRRLMHVVRRGDTVARFGGDEFVCVLEDLLDADEAEASAARIIASVQAPIVIAGREIVATASVGVAISGVPVEEPEELLGHADQAMYAAKRAGKQRATTFDPAMNPPAWALLDVVDDLRHALESDELYLVYQPIVELASGRIRAVEALVRWLHPIRGLISPNEFVPLAEKTDLIFALGLWVLEEACRQAGTWAALPNPNPSPAVSVNLSAREFDHPDLVERLAAILARTGLAPGRLILEITERVAMAEEGATTRTLRALKGLGVGLAVDDFGTGYSGLSTLKDSLVGTLKVDRAFVAGLGSDKRDTAIVRAVIALADALQLTTTAEGVETADQASALLALGCGHAQGYYFSYPLPLDELVLLLSRDDPFNLRKADLSGRIAASTRQPTGGAVTTFAYERALRTFPA